jgi:hypothetical protein
MPFILSYCFVRKKQHDLHDSRKLSHNQQRLKTHKIHGVIIPRRKIIIVPVPPERHRTASSEDAISPSSSPIKRNHSCNNNDTDIKKSFHTDLGSESLSSHKKFATNPEWDGLLPQRSTRIQNSRLKCKVIAMKLDEISGEANKRVDQVQQVSIGP